MHCVDCTTPLLEDHVPATHDTHDVAPVIDDHVPDKQFRQELGEVRPAEDDHVPA